MYRFNPGQDKGLAVIVENFNSLKHLRLRVAFDGSPDTHTLHCRPFKVDFRVLRMGICSLRNENRYT